MSDLFNGWPEDGEPVTTMSDEEMVEWCNKTQDTLIAQRTEIERLRNGLELIADPGDITSVEELGHIARFYLQESK